MDGGNAVEDPVAPESWEVADVEESMKRLLLSASSSAKDSATPSSSSSNCIAADDLTASGPLNLAFSSGAENAGVSGLSDDAINQVDQFLREALQNPRERLSSKIFLLFFISFRFRCMVFTLLC